MFPACWQNCCRLADLTPPLSYCQKCFCKEVLHVCTCELIKTRLCCCRCSRFVGILIVLFSFSFDSHNKCVEAKALLFKIILWVKRINPVKCRGKYGSFLQLSLIHICLQGKQKQIVSNYHIIIASYQWGLVLILFDLCMALLHTIGSQITTWTFPLYV